MNLALRPSLLLLLALHGSLCVKALDPVISQKQLPSGLKVIVCERSNNQASIVQMAFDFGKKDEADGNGGLAEVLREVLDGKSSKPKDVTFSEKMRRLGASTSSRVTKDQMVFQTACSSKLMDKVLEAESARLSQVLIEDDWLQYCTTQAVLHQQLRKEGWYESFNAARDSWIYPKMHPYRSKSQPDGFPVSLIVDKYNRYITADNAILIIVTSAKSDLVWLSVEKYFNQVPEKKPHYPKEEIDSLQLAPLVPSDTKVGRSASLLSYCIKRPAISDSDYASFQFLINQFYEGDLAVIRTAAGSVGLAVLSIVLENAETKYNDFTKIDIAVPYGNLSAMEKMINRVYGRYLYYGFSDTEIKNYLSQKAKRATVACARNENLAAELLAGKYYFGDPMQGFQSKAESLLSQDRLKACLRKYFISTDQCAVYTIE